MVDQHALVLNLLDANHGRWHEIARSYAAEDLEDLFQEILLQIWKSLSTFRGESSGNTWCYRVALNTALTWGRADQTRKRRLPVVGDASVIVTRTSHTQSDTSNVFESLIATLAPTDRAILLLALDDVSDADMVSIVGSTEGALRVRVHRIKQQLAETAKTQNRLENDDGL